MNNLRDPFSVATDHYRDPRGVMGILESRKIPFQVLRTFWISQVPENTWRGGHAHMTSEQLLICIEGEIQVELEDLTGAIHKYRLRPDSEALYIPNKCWGKFLFTKDTRALCMASDHFQENDYIRDYQEFEMMKNDYQNH